MASYAMTWRFGNEPRCSGRIELHSKEVALIATVPPVAARYVAFRDIVSVVLQRRTLHLRRSAGSVVTIDSLDRPGTLRELADSVTAAAAAVSAR
jgi:hypothetical protein